MSNIVDSRTSHDSSSPTRPFVTTAVVGAIVFLGLALVLKSRGGVDALDSSVAQWFATDRTSVMESVGTVVSKLTAPAMLIGAVVVASAALWWRKRRDDAVVLAASVFVAYAVGAIAKREEGRARPLAPINLSPESEASYPSGHVLVVATIAFVALGLAWANLDRTARITWTIVAAAAIAVVSLDRLVVGAHWLTDVIGSIALAAVIGSLALLARRKFARSSG